MGAAKKSNLQKSRKFATTFLPRDDFCAINENSVFEKNCKELVLKNESRPNLKASWD